MKQLGTAVAMYVQDYDNQFPIIRGANTAAYMDWKAAIQPYIKNSGIFKCPSNSASSNPATGDCIAMTPAPGTPVTYIGYGWATVGNATPNGFSYGNGVPGVVEAAIQAPADEVIITESTTTCTDFCEWCGGAAGPNPTSGHSAKSNFLFADYHVKTLKWGQTMTPRNMWTLDGTFSNVDGCNNNLAGCLNTYNQNIR